MTQLLRLAAGAAAALAVASLVRGPYWLLVLLTFLAAGLAAAIVRTPFAPPPRSLRDYVPDIVAPLLLAFLTVLAVRAFAPGLAPTPVLPALVWPLVDLWRPLGGGRSR